MKERRLSVPESEDKDDKLIIVPYRPKRKLWILFMIFVGYLFVAMLAYFGGQILALQHGNTQLKFDQKLAVKTELLEMEIAELNEEVAINQHHVVVEQQALEIVREENKALQKRNSELEELVAYYQRVMQPGHKDKGLIISELALKPTKKDRQFRFHFNLVQLSGDRKVTGYANLKVVGSNVIEAGNIIPAEYLLSELDGPSTKKGLKVGFLVYQEFTGVLTLPKSFIPQQVQILADLKSGKDIKLQRQYEWRVSSSSTTEMK